MCLYPKLIKNKKYTKNKKNGGVIPVVSDNRALWVTAACGKCFECGEVLVSKSQHHFVMCNCPNEAATDGGLSYQRYMAKDLDKIENLSKYVIMTEQEYQDMLERKRIEDERILQENIDAGLMIQFGGKWIHKSTYKIIMDNCFKLTNK